MIYHAPNFKMTPNFGEYMFDQKLSVGRTLIQVTLIHLENQVMQEVSKERNNYKNEKNPRDLPDPNNYKQRNVAHKYKFYKVKFNFNG